MKIIIKAERTRRHFPVNTQERKVLIVEFLILDVL